MPQEKSHRPVDTSKLKKKELERLLHTREAENQKLAKKLGEHLHVLKMGPHFIARLRTLPQKEQALAKGTQCQRDPS
jgi:hypothetical protein